MFLTPGIINLVDCSCNSCTLFYFGFFVLPRVLLYTILELVLSEFVPEIQESLPFFKGIGTQK